MKEMVWILIFIFFIGCVTSLPDFKPNSADEQSVKKFLLHADGAWNEKNVKEILGLYHPYAEIMSGPEQKMFSKKEYAKSLESIEWEMKAESGTPEIKPYGKDMVKVNINVIPASQQVILAMEFILIRSGNSWLIMKKIYEILH